MQQCCKDLFEIYLIISNKGVDCIIINNQTKKNQNEKFRQKLHHAHHPFGMLNCWKFKNWKFGYSLQQRQRWISHCQSID